MTPWTRGIALAIGTVALVALLLMELSMKVFLFSATQGVVTRNGVPVANAEVERSYRWGSKKQAGSDSTRTDAQGRFAFETASDSSLLHSFLPLHESVSQEIVVRADGTEYRAWSFQKDNFQDLGEVGRPLDLLCELTEQDMKREPHRGIAELAPAPPKGKATRDFKVVTP